MNVAIARLGMSASAVVTIGLMMPTGLAYAGPATAKITVNGQDISPNGQVSCFVDPTFEFTIQAGHDASSAYIQIDQSSLKVDKVRIEDADTVEYYFDPYEGQSGLDRGDAKVTKSGNNYKVTGHSPPIRNNTEGKGIQGAPLVPFEVDATCS